jgi:hypothetical protein
MAALDEHYKVTDDVIDDVTDDVTDDVIGGVGLGRRFAASSADRIIHAASPHLHVASPFKLHSSGLTASSVHLFESQLSLAATRPRSPGASRPTAPTPNTRSVEE